MTEIKYCKKCKQLQCIWTEQCPSWYYGGCCIVACENCETGAVGDTMELAIEKWNKMQETE